MGQGFVLIQENDPNHTCKLCQRYIKSSDEEHVLELMFWPAESSELNPIERFPAFGQQLFWVDSNWNWPGVAPKEKKTWLDI